MRGVTPLRILQNAPHRYLTTATPAKNVLDELESRGFVAATTSPTLRQHVAGPSSIYAGIDPSAPSLHVGNLLPLMGLLHFHLAGHQAIALVGGATGSIGDPSGRTSERPVLTPDQLRRNVEGITGQVQAFFRQGEELAARLRHEDGGSDEQVEGGTTTAKVVKVVNNVEWFGQMSLLEFLRDIGKNARVSAMLSKESVKSRMDNDSGISFTEFSYQLLQAHDFSVLRDKYNCRIQLGGSDQWGNIVAGIDLIKRRRLAALGRSHPQEQEARKDEAEDDDEVFGLTMPLLTTASGEKFGKSAGNAVWLDPERTSISDLYQFFFRQPDSMVETYLKTLTLLPVTTIEETMSKHRESPQDRTAQRVLAEQVTQLVHGRDALQRSLRAAELLFRTPVEQLKSAEVLEVFNGDTRLVRMSMEEVESQALRKVMASNGLGASASAASKACADGIVTVNGVKFTDHNTRLDRHHLLDEHLFVIQLGKKQHLIVYVE